MLSKNTYTEKQFPKESEVLRQIQDHLQKSFSKENQNLFCLFLCDPFSPLLSKFVSKYRPDKNRHGRFRFASSNPQVPSGATYFLLVVKITFQKMIRLYSVRESYISFLYFRDLMLLAL